MSLERATIESVRVARIERRPKIEHFGIIRIFDIQPTVELSSVFRHQKIPSVKMQPVPARGRGYDLELCRPDVLQLMFSMTSMRTVCPLSAHASARAFALRVSLA